MYTSFTLSVRNHGGNHGWGRHRAILVLRSPGNGRMRSALASILFERMIYVQPQNIQIINEHCHLHARRSGK